MAHDIFGMRNPWGGRGSDLVPVCNGPTRTAFGRQRGGTRDNPFEQGGNQPVEESGVCLRGSAPWKEMLSSRSVWARISSAFCIGYAAYIFYTWFYIYLVRVRGLTAIQGGVWGAAPFLAISLLAPLGGWFSDRAVARFGHRRGRQTALWVGVLCSGAMLGVGGHATNTTAAVILLAMAAGFNLFATATVWAVCIDLAPTFSGSLSGLMNTLGTLGGVVSESSP